MGYGWFRSVRLRQNLQMAGASLLGAAFLSPVLHADEGMWVYSNLPKTQLKEKYGFEPSAEWADRLMKSSVRFNNGGSGSIVSSDGLVLTNHHVAADTLQKLSSAQNDYYRKGFYAKTQAEELRAPDLELNGLVDIVDVTTRVNEAVATKLAPAEAAAARRATISLIEKESFEKTGLRSDVVTLYQGGQYHLYRYKKFTDVRLVFAPEFEIAFFGGDPDNFEYPRYNLDMTIFRVYENGKPAKVENFLKWSANGATDGELIFVSGHPGRTSRMFTVSALQFLRDVRVPYMLSLLRRREILLQQYSYGGEEQARQAKSELFGIQNSRKVYLGLLRGLQDNRLLASKQRAEYELRAKVESDAKLKAAADAWAKIAAAQKAHQRIFVRRGLLDSAQAFNSKLFGIARTLVRLAEENAKPNDKRLPEFRNSNRASLEHALFSRAPVYPKLEETNLADALSFLVEKLGENDPIVQQVLQGREPQERAAELVQKTSLMDVEVRRLIAKSGIEGLKQSYDPMIVLARAVDGVSRAVRKQYEETVEEIERQAYSQIAQALFATKGTSTYPDATFTLRLSYGEVKGYRDGGKEVSWATNLGGAFEHEASHGAKDPWKLPESWHKAKGSMNLSVPFNFVSTADIIGGNSGSPVVNRAGEVVGLIFDGNIQSLTADYVYTDEKSRAISVHSAGMIETLRKVHGASALADALGK